MIKYVARLIGSSMARVEKVEVDRETEKSVVLENGRRAMKVTDSEVYADTWADAHKILLDRADSDVKKARLTLARVNGVYGHINGMKE